MQCFWINGKQSLEYSLKFVNYILDTASSDQNSLRYTIPCTGNGKGNSLHFVVSHTLAVLIL